MIYKTFKYRLLPNKKQHTILSSICESQRVLYNAALQERIGCYEKTGKGRSYMDQCKSLTELRSDSRFSNIPANLQRWTLKRLDDAYKGLFSRVKRGEKAGFPRFRGETWWKSFGFAEFSGIKFDGNRVRFKGLIGGIRVHMSRDMPKECSIKTCVFKRDLKGWYICFKCEIPIQDIKHCGDIIGIDVGLNNFATLSNSDIIPNPRIAKRHEKELRIRQRALSRCTKGSKRRKKVRIRVTRLYNKISNIRKTFLHQKTTDITTRYSLIAVEDLRIKNMVKSYMGKSIHDASWGEFINMLIYKAESAGGKVVKVNPRNTSQACSGCGHIVKKDLSVRIHKCECGTILDRDHNAALNILALAVMGQEKPNVAEYCTRATGNINLRGILK